MGNSKLSNWIIKNNNFTSFICAVFLALVFAIAQWSPETCLWDRLQYNIFPALLVAIASFLATQGVIIVLNYGIRYRELLETRIERIENKLNQALEIMTIDAEDNSFQNKLRLLREKEGGVKWIISKFIAKQLALKFSELSFRINGHTYSNFSKKLYYEVDGSLFLTNSFNPYEWTRGLISYPDYEKIVSTLVTQSKETFDEWWRKEITDNDLEEKYTPEHIKAWKDIAKNNVNRKRLIVLHKSELENFFVYESFYFFFKKINDINDKDDSTRFTTYDYLKHIGISVEADKYDYAIFDKEIALEWQIYSDNYESDTFNKTKITLIDLKPSDSNNKAQSLKDFEKIINDNWNRLDKIKQVEDKIIKSKQKYLDSMKNDSNATLHSYCYHAYGGDCWKNINATSEYDLGRREQHFLKDFLLDTIKQNKNVRSCNVLHIGVGSGIEIESIINSLRQEEREIQHYTIVDISPNILERTQEKLVWLKKYNKINNINFKNICEDVTTPGWSYERPDNNPLIIILVANGFLFSQESLLKNISVFMKKEDYLLVTVEINNTVNSINNLNKMKESYRIDSALKLFNNSLNPLGINTFKKSNIEADCRDYYEFDFNKKTPVENAFYKKDIFEGFFNLKAWKKNNKDWHPAEFKELDKIKIFQSYKPSSLASVKSYLDIIDGGFLVTNLKSEDDFNEFKNSNLNQIGLVIQKES
jgi:hypothetical protein